ncbi:MAG: carbon monoxide dehydrogenase subunit G [Acidobacteria bacterium]|nr:carbon monoxide dehydrogenase subunit G [Acidobacteriota bacterium]
MKIEGSYTIKFSRERLFSLLVSPDILQRCVPGCQSLETNEDGSYNMVMKTGIGSIKGVFNGLIRLGEVDEPNHFTMLVEGKGAPGFLKGQGALDLTEQDNETTICYSGDVAVGGTLASVGQRMVQSAAKMMAGQFFASIEAEAKAIAKAEESGLPVELPKHGFLRNTIRQIRN